MSGILSAGCLGRMIDMAQGFSPSSKVARRETFPFRLAGVFPERAGARTSPDQSSWNLAFALPARQMPCLDLHAEGSSACDRLQQRCPMARLASWPGLGDMLSSSQELVFPFSRLMSFPKSELFCGLPLDLAQRTLLSPAFVRHFPPHAASH